MIKQTDMTAIRVARDTLRRLDQAVGPMSIHRAITLLELAYHGGQDVAYHTVLARLGWSHPQLSKNLTDMSPFGRNGRPGLGWVRVEMDPANRQRRLISLTDEGWRIAGIASGVQQ